MKQLHVKKTTLMEHGAVSEQTVKEMLQGLLSELNTNLGVAISASLDLTEVRPKTCRYHLAFYRKSKNKRNLKIAIGQRPTQKYSIYCSCSHE